MWHLWLLTAVQQWHFSVLVHAPHETVMSLSMNPRLLSSCHLILQMISAQVLNVFLTCFWNNFQSWLPPDRYYKLPVSSQVWWLSREWELSFQIGYAWEHTGLFSDCGFLHANVNFVHKSLFSPAISSCTELPRHAQWKQVYKHAFPVIPCLSPVLLTLTLGVRTELVLDATNCEWKGCRKSFTHNKMLHLTKLINLKQRDELHKRSFSCLWIQK